jgi:FKBP-type peptidyl-prolyl cis-trans isomerase
VLALSACSGSQVRSEGDSVVTLASGVKILDLVEGSGPGADAGQTVRVHYKGMFSDGRAFDSSLERGTPFAFKLGGRQVIPGWEEGVKGMKVGGKRRLVIPASSAYGDRGVAGVIPPGATLTFEVELLSVN